MNVKGQTQTEQKRNGNKTHKRKQTYRLRRRMADPGKDKNRKKIKIEHGKLIYQVLLQHLNIYTNTRA